MKIKSFDEFLDKDEWYSYLINEYIPNQGEKDVFAFIDLEFSAVKYIIWKAKELGLFSKELAQEITKKLKEENNENSKDTIT